MNDAAPNSAGRTGLHRASLVWVLVAAVLGQPSCLKRREEPPLAEGQCAACHGDPSRQGGGLLAAAPPHAVSGASDVSHPGVGAHSIHLVASDTHGPVACDECHVVPNRTDAAGHADDALPAEIVFGRLARAGDRTPHYDPETRRCSDTSCHRDAAYARWTVPRDSKRACGSCHGLPPPSPHPQSERCHACHGEIIDERGVFIAPELHVDGLTQTSPGECSLCHGSEENAAPPSDTTGHTQASAIGVGAHQAHLSGGRYGRKLACAECHAVPEPSQVAEHVQGREADVLLVGVAAAFERAPAWNRESGRCSNTWCHGPGPNIESGSPRWADAAELGCTSCHGAPPAPPHPQVTACAGCHGEIVGPDHQSIIDASRHVDGVVDLKLDGDCRSCHGGATAAPPLDLSGNLETTSPGVGAHQIHLDGTERAKAVACGACHVVPLDVLDRGHIDTATPAEVTFSGVAVAYGGTPAYANGRCENTSCHGGVFPLGHASGATNPAPTWTALGASPIACDSCHGLPPPRPHPYPTNCSGCHENVAADNVTFVRPDLHVDGTVTFTVP